MTTAVPVYLPPEAENLYSEVLTALNENGVPYAVAGAVSLEKYTGIWRETKDLDLFMTGYDLWATEGSIRAAAHYDLAHSPVQHTVSALLLVWDGAELIADEADQLGAALGSPGTRRAPSVAA